MNLWTKSIHDISVHDNFADKSNLKNNGTNCTVENNVMDLKPEQMEEGAAAIAKKAGLEPAYASLWNKIPKPTLELVDDTDPKIQYEGAWSASSGRKLGDLNDTVHFARTSGASATYAFTGKGIEVLMETNKDEGTVEVSIDGAVAKNIDCKTETRGVQQVMFSQDWPEEAPHVIKVESVSGGFIVLDGFKVRHRKAE